MIKIDNLTKTFGEVAALDNVTCEIEKGAVYGLVGSNGSGKSTMLRLLSGVYRQDSGEISLDGETVWENRKTKSRIFFLGDTPFYLHQSSLNEMAKFYRMFYPSFSDEKFAELKNIFPIDAKMKIASMSKGMQRQAILTLALSSQPDYLFLDEAFDGLDPVIRQVLKKLLAGSVSEDGVTAIIASHNLRELEDLCDSVGLLHKGGVLLSSHLDSVKEGLHKVQAAFKQPPEEKDLDGLDIIKSEKTGSLLTMVIRGERADIISRLSVLNPLFLEAISPTLEEIFIYELEVTGYDVTQILN